LLWECREARRIWAAYNEFRDFNSNASIIQTDQQDDKVQEYEEKIGRVHKSGIGIRVKFSP
ncbi:MAG: hypothetical protein NTZ94_09120, partial [Verrucomicrobia bacterium]|nr:hypothetical protein [Verrucomicrobiota bacterium]